MVLSSAGEALRNIQCVVIVLRAGCSHFVSISQGLGILFLPIFSENGDIVDYEEIFIDCYKKCNMFTNCSVLLNAAFFQSW